MSSGWLTWIPIIYCSSFIQFQSSQLFCPRASMASHQDMLAMDKTIWSRSSTDIVSPLLPTILRVVWWCTSTGIWDKLIHKTTFWTFYYTLYRHILEYAKTTKLSRVTIIFDLNSNLAEIVQCICNTTFCIMIRVSLHTKSSSMFHAEFVYKLFPPKWRIRTMKTLSYKPVPLTK
jgi:hypothetical protein